MSGPRVIVDDGNGMDYETLFHYLQGFSTRYMSKATIGKYGVGAKLAALNYAKAIDVWSRVDSAGPWLHVSFDLTRTIEEEARGEMPTIEPPAPDPVPESLARLLPSGTGTLVVWSKVDRLEEGRHARDVNQLRVDIEKELSRIFRRFLEGGIQIWINDTKLLPHDPLFLMERTWATEIVLKDHEDVRAKVVTEREELPVDGAKAYLTVTVYPPEVVRRRGQGGDNLAKKLRVPENQGSISFVRLNQSGDRLHQRAADFPRGVEDPDRFIGIEVSFEPELDDYFGIRNVKRGVEPHGELRNTIRKRLRKYVRDARGELERLWGKAQRESKEHQGEHSQLTEAVKAANRTLPKGRAKGPDSAGEHDAVLEQLAKDVGIREQERDAYRARVRDRSRGWQVQHLHLPCSPREWVRAVNCHRGECLREVTGPFRGTQARGGGQGRCLAEYRRQEHSDRRVVAVAADTPWPPTEGRDLNDAELDELYAHAGTPAASDEHERLCHLRVRCRGRRGSAALRMRSMARGPRADSDATRQRMPRSRQPAAASSDWRSRPSSGLRIPPAGTRRRTPRRLCASVRLHHPGARASITYSDRRWQRHSPTGSCVQRMVAPPTPPDRGFGPGP